MKRLPLLSMIDCFRYAFAILLPLTHAAAEPCRFFRRHGWPFAGFLMADASPPAAAVTATCRHAIIYAAASFSPPPARLRRLPPGATAFMITTPGCSRHAFYCVLLYAAMISSDSYATARCQHTPVLRFRLLPPFRRAIFAASFRQPLSTDDASADFHAIFAMPMLPFQNAARALHCELLP